MYYTQGDATQFRVRCGPNYSRLGNKQPSAKAMYTLLSADFGRAPTRTSHVARHMVLPELPPGGDAGLLPPMIIVHVNVPLIPPTLLSETPDGPTVSGTFCFAATSEAQADSRQQVPSAAAKLMTDFGTHARVRGMEAGTFKVIAMARNIEELSVPRPLQRFNGKPILIRRSADLHVGDKYIEIDIYVDRFSFIAQRGLFSFLPKVKHSDCQVAFLLQGTADSELPECVFGAVDLLQPDYESFPTLPDEFFAV